MVWKHKGKEIKEGRSWVQEGDVWYKDIQHPSNWAIWSDSEKINNGLVWENDPAPFDDRFYHAAGIERKLADSGDEIGLKTYWINNTKSTAKTKLQASDWYITRKMEDSTEAVPSNITKYRSDVRAACNTIETKIKAASDMTAFKKLFEADSAGVNAVIHTWPKEV